MLNLIPCLGKKPRVRIPYRVWYLLKNTIDTCQGWSFGGGGGVQKFKTEAHCTLLLLKT